MWFIWNDCSSNFSYFCRQVMCCIDQWYLGEVIYCFNGNSLFLPTGKVDICDKTRLVIRILQEIVLEKKQMTAELFRNHFPIGFPVGKKWWRQNAFKIIFDQNYNKKKAEMIALVFRNHFRSEFLLEKLLTLPIDWVMRTWTWFFLIGYLFCWW